MTVDQAGQYPRVAEVDRLRTRRHRERVHGRNRLDLVAFDENSLVIQNVPARDIDQVAYEQD